MTLFNDLYLVNHTQSFIFATDYTEFGKIQNSIQWEYDCCGVDSYQDYNMSVIWPVTDYVHI